MDRYPQSNGWEIINWKSNSKADGLYIMISITVKEKNNLQKSSNAILLTKQ